MLASAKLEQEKAKDKLSNMFSWIRPYFCHSLKEILVISDLYLKCPFVCACLCNDLLFYQFINKFVDIIRIFLYLFPSWFIIMFFLFILNLFRGSNRPSNIFFCILTRCLHRLFFCLLYYLKWFI